MLFKKRHTEKDTPKITGRSAPSADARMGSTPKLFIRSRKARVTLGIVVILTGVIAGSYLLSGRSQNRQDEAVITADDSETYDLYGQKIKIPKEFIRKDQKPSDAVHPSTEGRIKQLEERHAKGVSDFESYYILAGLYEENKDINNAIRNYQNAKSKLDVASTGYQDAAAEIDKKIKELEASR